MIRIDTLPRKSLVIRPVLSSQPCPSFCSTPTSISTPGILLHTSLSVVMLSNWDHSLLSLQLAPWKVQGRIWFSMVGWSSCRSHEWTHMVLLTLQTSIFFFFKQSASLSWDHTELGLHDCFPSKTQPTLTSLKGNYTCEFWCADLSISFRRKKKKKSHFKVIHTFTLQFGITPLSIALTSRIEISQAITFLEKDRHHH